ncbi:HD domain-containing protein [Candidatus Woesearchaeota archaeon]|nr:HD domain-containing protein [Candidatus Woesearchaeota archaeon]
MIPNFRQCVNLLTEYAVKETIFFHSFSVANYALKTAETLEKKGHKINKELVLAAALLHDIKKLNAKHHTKEGAELLENLGYEEVAEIVKKHGFECLEKNPPKTIEEKIVFYADKRDEWGQIVTLEERFEKLKERYGPNQNWGQFYEYTKSLEKELIGEEA